MIRCYVTRRASGDIEAGIARAISEGVDFIQIREKDLSARELLELAVRARSRAEGSRARVLVNGRLDIALAADLDGVHLPANGLPPPRVRPFVRTLGVSTHSVEEAIAAQQAGADFVFFGPIFETPGKSPVGISALRAVTAVVRIPVLAIGGITIANTPEVLAAGAAGIAAIRLFQGV
ncbi:MAG TPA: thiamine phosphate synthase [Terriglobia bacterium]|nr:thiamine phosphate synthase [Terriglobia bacterium]